MPVPKGTRIGGRQKGTPNKRTAALVEEVEASGLTPLAYMLSVMRDDNADEARRLDAAKSAAPFIHPKLSAVDANLKGEVGLTVNVFANDD